SRMVLGQAARQAGLDLYVEHNYFPLIGEALVRRGWSRPGWAEGSEDAWFGDELYVGELNVEQRLLGRPITLRVVDPTTYELFEEEYGVIGRGTVGQRFSSEEPFVEIVINRIEAPANVVFTITKRSDTQMIRNLQERFQVAQRGPDTGILE